MEAHAYVRNIREVHIEADKLGVVAVAGLIVHLQLISKRSDSLMAVRHVRKPEKAIEIVDKLKAAGLRPNIVKSSPYYMVYIATADLLGLAEKDEAIKKAIALYLAEKIKNGTPRQREIAKKNPKEEPSFFLTSFCVLKACFVVCQPISNRNAELSQYGSAEPTTANMRN